MNKKLQAVLDFWFTTLTNEDRFSGKVEVDNKIAEQFLELHKEVAANEFWKYRGSAQSSLAEVIVLDQFSRNMFRADPRSFACDGQALALAQQAVLSGLDKELSEEERMFMYMPFMHSESKQIHVEGLPLFESLGIEETIQYEHIHKDIIDRFGRYPHRNEVLGRENTPEEAEYLNNNHESFF